MTSSARVLKLQSSDGEIFEVDERVAVQSVTIKNMIDDEFDGSGVFPLPNVSSGTLSKVIEWCQEHGKEGATTAESMNEFKNNFMEMALDDLYDTIMAANYLNVMSLLGSCCQRVADLVKGKTPDQIRATFNIVNDYTPEEEEEIRKNNSWAFD